MKITQESIMEFYNSITKIDDIVNKLEEKVRDLISIVHVFSSRLYGLRNYKNRINEDCKEDIN